MSIPDTLTISALRKTYREGTTTPRELIGALVKRIRSSDNPAVWIHRLDAAAVEPWLRRLEEADPDSLPLYGIPFAIKDNIDLAGVPTTAGCAGYAYVPEKSAFVVEKLIQAGAVPLGKTNLDQFATGLVGVRSPYGVPRNPLAAGRVPGGSSSGSAVALAEGLVSFSLGTDTAGSGRVPAAFNGLWGVKPSCGRLSTRGVVPACRSLDCVSIFALDAEDAATVLQVAEGFDPEDPYARPLKDRSGPSSGRIGIPRPEQLMFFGDAGYDKAWHGAVAGLREKGWEIIEIDFEPFLKAARLLYEGPWVAERYTALEAFFTSAAGAIFPVTRKIISGGADHAATDVFSAMYKLAALKRESEKAWDGLDAIVTPTAGGFPWVRDLDADPIGPNSQLGYYTNFMNLLDLSAVATPAGTTAVGLPFGITWIAPRDSDKTLIQIAAYGPSKEEAGDSLPILLFGAHMSGLPLNPQVLALGASYVGEVTTAPCYKMVHLPEPVPARPGVLRVAEGGAAITAEEWRFPRAALGDFLATIRQPLGLGEIELSDGRKCHGFLCEAAVAEQAEDISASGGWRAFLQAT